MKRHTFLPFLSVALSLVVVLGATSTSNIFAQRDWFALFYRDGGMTRVKAFDAAELDSLAYYAEADSAVYPSHVSLVWRGGERLELPIDSVRSVAVRDNVARVYITTDSLVDEVADKENYLSARFLYVPGPGSGSGSGDTLDVPVSIRGRGNTTWFMPKKPYRLKFDKKQPLAGMAKAKSFVLIANYLDNTLMKNAVAFRMAELAGMPYVNSSVPVDLYFNGTPRGSYMLSQKIGINSGSADFDEYYGMLWEIDSYYDEEYRFRTSRYDLPCMAKDPDFLEIADEDPVTAAALWAYWKADLDLAVAKVYDGKWQEVFDARQLAKYVLVNNLAGNFEMTQAKSIYLYKKAPGEKYCFGPVWDFDWAFGFLENQYYPVDCKLVFGGEAYDFWIKIFKDPEFLAVFREELEAFRQAGGLEAVMAFIDEYAEAIRISAAADGELWPDDRFYGFEKREIHKGRFDDNVERLKAYIAERFSCILSHGVCLLY